MQSEKLTPPTKHCYKQISLPTTLAGGQTLFGHSVHFKSQFQRRRSLSALQGIVGVSVTSFFLLMKK